jgi:hypothetical protein
MIHAYARSVNGSNRSDRVGSMSVIRAAGQGGAVLQKGLKVVEPRAGLEPATC